MVNAGKIGRLPKYVGEAVGGLVTGLEVVETGDQGGQQPQRRLEHALGRAGYPAAAAASSDAEAGRGSGQRRNPIQLARLHREARIVTGRTKTEFVRETICPWASWTARREIDGSRVRVDIRQPEAASD